MHPSPPHQRSLSIALVMASSIVIVELVGGLLSNSLALLSDAGHVFTDSLALALSLFAARVAARPHTPSLTYGYHRAEILAAFANGATLFFISAYILYEAYQRALRPPQVRGTLLLAFALVGLAANFAMLLILRRVKEKNLNVRAAVQHVLGDTLSSVGVIAGGAVVVLTGLQIVDPIVGAVIAMVILRNALGVLRDSARILLEAVPSHLDPTEVAEAIAQVDGVSGVHDLHIWTITSGMSILTAHLKVQDQKISQAKQVLMHVERMLRERFGIRHLTLQLEAQENEIVKLQVGKKPEEHPA